MTSRPVLLDSESAYLIEPKQPEKKYEYTGKIWFVIAILAVVIVAAITIGVSVQRKYVYPLDQLVTVPNIMRHLSQLYSISQAHPSRSRSVLNAYNDSAEYIVSVLSGINNFCNVSRHHFKAAIYNEGSPAQLQMVQPYNFTFQFNTDFRYFIYGGEGIRSIIANVTEVPNLGCSEDDFIGFPEGNIALIRTSTSGDCRNWDKAFNAQNANAIAAILYNPISRTALMRGRIVPGINSGWLEDDPYIFMPVLSASYTVGSTLSHLISVQSPVTLSVFTNQSITFAYTYNVLCTTYAGNKNSIIVLGSHLDSVPEGPGINDNGSGSATNLEIAVQMHNNGIVPQNAIRFAWWGAEEVGLVGSTSYVRELNETNEINNIAVMLNMDMIGSPNFIPIVTDGSNNGSKIITKMLSDYITDKAGGVLLFNTSFGRTDFVAFDVAGVPIGNLFTGAEGIKNRTQQLQYGGYANAPMDPCYHQYCDDINNINHEVLSHMSSALAYVVETLAQKPDLRSFIRRDETVLQRTIYEEWN